MTRRAWLLFIALSVIWGIPYLLIKVAVRELTPASLVFLRTIIGALLLLPVMVRRGDLRALLPRWRPILLFTAVEVALPWWLLSDAERRISSSLSGLLVASVPLVGALLSRLSDAHEPLGARRLAGLVTGFAGVVALLGLDLSGDLAAVGEMALVVLGYALGPLIISRRLPDLPTSEVVAVSLGLCALAYAPLAIAQLPPTLPSPAVIGAVAVLGVACTALCALVGVGAACDHLRESGGRAGGGGVAARRAVHSRHRDRLHPHPRGLLARHRPVRTQRGGTRTRGSCRRVTGADDRRPLSAATPQASGPSAAAPGAGVADLIDRWAAAAFAALRRRRGPAATAPLPAPSPTRDGPRAAGASRRG